MSVHRKIDQALHAARQQGVRTAPVIVRLEPGTQDIPRVPGLTVHHHFSSVPALAGELELAYLDEAGALAEVAEIEADSEASAGA